MESEGIPKKILIVDDQADDRVFMRFALEKSRYVVSEAASGEQGLLSAYASQPDLILLDINLGGRMDGWDVLKRLKATQKTNAIPVLIVSGLDYIGDRDIRLEAKAAGSPHYLMKPFTLSQLFDLVERTLIASADAGVD